MKQELDFVVIGAQKGGTTALFEYLRRHPGLALPAGKEAPYFSHDAAWARPWEEYLRKTFALADPACRWGTVTTHYMVGGLYEASPASLAAGLAGDVAEVPRRMHARLPDVRLIAVLRDPVARAVSHHRMMVMTGAEERPAAQALAELLEPEALVGARAHPRETSGYVVWGEYARILAGYLEVFDAGQLLVVFSEDLLAKPRQTLARVHEFIGVPDIPPDNLGESYRTASGRRRLAALNLYDAQRAVASSRAARSLWHALPERLRRRADHTFERASYRVDLWNRRSDTASAEPDADLLARLREHYRSDGERLATELGVTPPWSDVLVG